MRCFRAKASDYEAVRARLDAALGFPSARAVTSIEPAATAPRDTSGMVIVAVHEESLSVQAIAGILADVIGSRVAVEITPDDYASAMRAVLPAEGV